MSILSEQKIVSRLKDLTERPESIQTMSSWLLHHAKPGSMDVISETWLKEVSKETSSKRMVNLMWVANEVIQTSRKKGPELANVFFPRVESAFRILKKKPHDEGVDKCLKRLVEVWEQRHIFHKEQMQKLETALGKKNTLQKDPRAPLAPSSHSASPFTPVSPKASNKLEFSAEKMTQLERSVNEMAQVLRRLEKPPSCNEEVRQHLASFPESTANTSFLAQVRCEEEAQKILEQTKEAGPICKDYCDSLANEVLDRRNLQNHLTELLETVKTVATRNASMIEEMHKREESMRSQVSKVQKAFDSLPDLDDIQIDVEHAQLPSVKDLFR